MSENYNLKAHKKAALKIFNKGEVLWGRYRIEKCIGEGASAVVYKCADLELSGLAVALKIFPAKIADDEISALRINRELRTSFAVDHPNVARFYNCLRDENFIGLVMEYVEGGTLDRFVGNLGGRISVNEARFILMQICEGLDAIHRAGAIHRDLKPANVLISADGGIKITDFGLARDALGMEVEELNPNSVDGTEGDAAQTLKTTRVGDCIGTPLYLSPEYLEHGIIDARSDIYALGVIGFELVAGFEPFEAKSFIKLVSEKLHEPTQKLVDVVADCNQVYSDIIELAMHKDPEERYQGARDVLEDLRAIKTSDSAHSFVYSPSQALHVASGAHKVKNIRSSAAHVMLGQNTSSYFQSIIFSILIGLPVIALTVGCFFIIMNRDMPWIDYVVVWVKELIWKLGF